MVPTLMLELILEEPSSGSKAIIYFPLEEVKLISSDSSEMYPAISRQF